MIVDLLVLVVFSNLNCPLIQQIVAVHSNNNATNFPAIKQLVDDFHCSNSLSGSGSHCQNAMLFFQKGLYCYVLMNPFTRTCRQRIRPIRGTQFKYFVFNCLWNGKHFEIAVFSIPDFLETSGIRIDILLCTSPRFEDFYAFIILESMLAVVDRAREG